MINKFVPLRKSGKSLIGLCPFHEEKTPSFFVNNLKGVFHCFGCNASGDIFKFIQKIKNVSFIESVHFLAKSINLNVPSSKRNLLVDLYKRNLIEILECSSQWFQEQLYINKVNNKLLSNYLDQRNINDEIIKLFRIGYAPDNGLINFLEYKGVSEGLQKDAGLILSKNEKRIEVFRNRLIFPILDYYGKINGFGGRILSGSNGDYVIPKYINSQESVFFSKSKVLYGLYQVKSLKDLIIVEGYLDVISLFQNEFKNVVSILGTSLTEYQLQLIWKYCSNPLICFDGDQPGSKAMKRISINSLEFLRPGYTVSFCFLPNDEDPDSLIRNKGRQFFKEYILNNTKSLFEVLWEYLLENKDLQNPDQRALIQYEIIELLKKINNPIIKVHYKQEFRKKFYTLIKDQENVYNNKIGNFVIENYSKNLIIRKIEKEKILLLLLIKYPLLLRKVHEDLLKVKFRNIIYEKIKSTLLKYDKNQKNLETLEKLFKSDNIDKNELDNLLNSYENFYLESFINSTTSLETAYHIWLRIWNRVLKESLVRSSLFEKNI